jgi:ATP-dependent RNA helicase RhlE
VSTQEKRSLLLALLADPAMSRVIVFSRTKHGANKLAQVLDRAGHRADAIHGNKSQNARQRSLEDFRAGRSRILVATDIAARGIDIDDVTHVVNLDVPDVAETYVHRIGRTARAGNGGVAISFCDPSERDSLRAIERLVRRSLTVASGKDVVTVRTRAHAQKPPQGEAWPRDRKRFRKFRGRRAA